MALAARLPSGRCQAGQDLAGGARDLVDVGDLMKIDQVEERVAGLPHMTARQAQAMTSVILENRCTSILELGFRHGVSTCYMAAALDELGTGHITTIDLTTARDESPNVDELLRDLDLAHLVTVFYEPTSYLWRLMKLLEADPQPRFDLCYIDGAHTWFTDGFAFLLVDRLLDPGGLVVFDDLDWTCDSSPALRRTAEVERMPPDERTTPQVRKVYDLLVKTHPDYGGFVEKDGWAYARKAPNARQAGGELRREVVYQREQVGLGAAAIKAIKKIRR
jgi:predicted O-methyltransferase YrrM